MERRFLSQKGSGGRGVKEKNLNNALNKEVVKDGVVPSVTVASGINVDMQEENLGQSSTGPSGSESETAVSFATLLKGDSRRTGLNFRTLITQAGNGADVVVPLESIRVVSERYANSAYGFFLGKRAAYPVVANYVRNTWGKYGLVKSMLNSSTGLFFFQFSSIDSLHSMLENGPWFIRINQLILKKWNPDVNLMKEDVGNVPVLVKLHGVPELHLGRSSYARALIEIWADEELKDTIVVAMPKLVGMRSIRDECPKNMDSSMAKNMKNPSQAPWGVSVGPRMGFKPAKQVYRTVPKKYNAKTKESKKNDVELPKEVSNSNLFDVLNSVENDVDLGTNGRSSNPANGEGKPVEKVDFSSDHDKSYENAAYYYDPYDDDMYEDQDVPDKIQSICDSLDIKVRG
ncbi:zinc finger, CCHC-type containing protein [Tanacetum coccineum]